ncbi:MAG: hypothetical protein MUO31_07155 [Thermodesulfovibrionales bacterium]|nr:hypothetical protein [Thermodesulfovibrionales bacterium]
MAKYDNYQKNRTLSPLQLLQLASPQPDSDIFDIVDAECRRLPAHMHDGPRIKHMLKQALFDQMWVGINIKKLVSACLFVLSGQMCKEKSGIIIWMSIYNVDFLEVLPTQSVKHPEKSEKMMALRSAMMTLLCQCFSDKDVSDNALLHGCLMVDNAILADYRLLADFDLVIFNFLAGLNIFYPKPVVDRIMFNGFEVFQFLYGKLVDTTVVSAIPITEYTHLAAKRQSFPRDLHLHASTLLELIKVPTSIVFTIDQIIVATQCEENGDLCSQWLHDKATIIGHDDWFDMAVFVYRWFANPIRDIDESRSLFCSTMAQLVITFQNYPSKLISKHDLFAIANDAISCAHPNTTLLNDIRLVSPRLDVQLEIANLIFDAYFDVKVRNYSFTELFIAAFEKHEWIMQFSRDEPYSFEPIQSQNRETTASLMDWVHSMSEKKYKMMDYVVDVNAMWSDVEPNPGLKLKKAPVVSKPKGQRRGRRFAGHSKSSRRRQKCTVLTVKKNTSLLRRLQKRDILRGLRYAAYLSNVSAALSVKNKMF